MILYQLKRLLYTKQNESRRNIKLEKSGTFLVSVPALTMSVRNGRRKQEKKILLLISLM
jgi:hypothetical protein